MSFPSIRSTRRDLRRRSRRESNSSSFGGRASSQASRVCIYAESTVFEHDWEVMPFAMAAHAELKARRRPLDGGYADHHSSGCRDAAAGGFVWTISRGFAMIKAASGSLRASIRCISCARSSPGLIRASLKRIFISISGELLGSQRVQRGLTSNTIRRTAAP